MSWWQRLARWWAEFSLQTKLLAAATLVVSLVMAGICFFALNGIQADVILDEGLFFASADALSNRLSELVHQADPEVHTIVLDFEGINFIDSTKLIVCHIVNEPF